MSRPKVYYVTRDTTRVWCHLALDRLLAVTHLVDWPLQGGPTPVLRLRSFVVYLVPGEMAKWPRSQERSTNHTAPKELPTHKPITFAPTPVTRGQSVAVNISLCFAFFGSPKEQPTRADGTGRRLRVSSSDAFCK